MLTPDLLRSALQLLGELPHHDPADQSRRHDKNPSITLSTMTKAAEALGLKLTLQARQMTPDEFVALARTLRTTPDKKMRGAIKEQLIAGFYGDEAIPHADNPT